MSQVISMRMKEHQVERLRRLARRLGHSAGETSALLVEEGLRRVEFPFVDFRDSPVGRQAYVQGSSLAVWEVALVARDFDNDVEAAARHLEWPAHKVQAALHYAAAFAPEIDTAIADAEAGSTDDLVRLLPQARPVLVTPAREPRTAP